jgi:uncharacterized membrane protein YeaQ/YmgE (transglycosylase-associated protein family)
MVFVLLAVAAIIALLLVGGIVFALAFKLLWWALIGLLIGALARLALPGRQPIGVLMTALNGIAGSLLGGVIARAAHLGAVLQFIIAIAVAAALIAAFAHREQAGAR